MTFAFLMGALLSPVHIASVILGASVRSWTGRILGIVVIAIIGGLIAAPISNLPFDPLFCAIYLPFAAGWTAVGAFVRKRRAMARSLQGTTPERSEPRG